jgi:hypothetical protein
MANSSKPQPGEVVAGDPVNPRPGMNRAWEQVAEMTAGAAVEACFTVRGIEYVEVAKLKPGYTTGIKVGELRPGDPNPEDLEQYVLRNWGPGVYILSPMYRGHRIRSRSFPFGGEAAFEASVKGLAGPEVRDELSEVDKQIADTIRRRSAMVTLRELTDAEKKGGDDMTPEQLEKILDKVTAKPADNPLIAVLHQQNQFMMEMLKLERDRADKLMAAASDHRPTSTDPNTMLGLGAALLPFIGKLPPKSLGTIMNGVMRFLSPQQEAPESGWTPEQVMQTIQMAGPLVQGVLGPLLEAIRGAFVPAGAPAPSPTSAAVVTVPPVVIPQPTAATNGGGIVPIELNAEEKMAMDLFFQFLGQKDYESCWGTLGTTEKTIMLNFAVMELKDAQRPEALLPLFLRFDVRAQGLIRELTEYLVWGKTVKKPEIEKEETEDDKAEAAEGGDGGR